MHSSRTPRRSFAAPLVMTIAAIPACLVTSKPPPSNQPEPQVRDHRKGDETTTVTHENPPRPDSVEHTPTPDQQAPDHDRKWTVMIDQAGACTAMGEMSCPANATCNPPPPSMVACPSGITVDRPVQIWASAGSNDCYITVAAAKCPAKATCNPPPPQKTACPQ